MTEKIVSIRGAVVPDTAVPDVVEALESLLERAKKGEIISVAYAASRPNGTFINGWTKEPEGSGWILWAGISQMAHRYQKVVEEESEE